MNIRICLFRGQSADRISADYSEGEWHCLILKTNRPRQLYLHVSFERPNCRYNAWLTERTGPYIIFNFFHHLSILCSCAIIRWCSNHDLIDVRLQSRSLRASALLPILRHKYCCLSDKCKLHSCIETNKLKGELLYSIM